MCESLLLPNQELIAVKYFTAKVNDSKRARRQNIYIEALENCRKIEIKLGYFSVHKIKMPSANSDFKQGRIDMVDVIKTEEKGTDVNLAVQMAVDAVRDNFDYAMLFSNDSDMAYSVQIAAKECQKKVGLYISSNATSHWVLKENTCYVRRMTGSFLAKHRFPDKIVTNTGRTFAIPKDW